MRKAEKLDRCAIFFVRLEKHLNNDYGYILGRSGVIR